MTSATIPLHPVLAAVTARITEASRDSRAAYEAQMHEAAASGTARGRLSCGNQAHGFAAADEGWEKLTLKLAERPNIGIVTAYNDMLSAHQPYETYPDQIKAAAREVVATAQVAGGVPAMCDGVTQGRGGMELSLISRDVVAMSAAIGLSHDVFDAALYLGICDKIVPGLFIAAARFGHLGSLFVPSGPMASGLPNPDKAKVRQRYALGEASRAELLEAEAASYHAPGTCTFYGTANSNQMLMEAMGLHLPGAAFVAPNSPLRTALTRAATQRAVAISALGEDYTPFHAVVTAKSIVNATVALLATGGSTNHTLHLVAMAAAAGIHLTWQDIADLSHVTPLLARIYPNGVADINHFQAAGGCGFLFRELIEAGLLHEDVQTVSGFGLRRQTQEPWLDGGVLRWRPAASESLDLSVLRPASDPFSPHGGMALLSGNLGRAVLKTSALKPQDHRVRAPAKVFASQEALQAAFEAGELTGDFVAVVVGQGPRANGMPELHNLTPVLGALLDRGQKVGLITDGRMSGASGKVPAAIHLTPEALGGGSIGKIIDGDMVLLDAEQGLLQVEVAADVLAARPAFVPDARLGQGLGRELFAGFRAAALPADRGGGFFSPV
jgi:phosphogluconate dehydratase